MNMLELDPKTSVDLADKIQENKYYQKIQSDLKRKNSASPKKEPQIAEDKTPSQNKPPKDSVNAHQESLQNALLTVEDEIQIKSFLWKKNSAGGYDVSANQDQPSMLTRENVYNDGFKLLNFLGIRINIEDKINSLKEAYTQNTVQSRSHNFFMSKYCQFKVGILGQILSLLGVASSELRKLQKQALKSAIEENIGLVGESIYNLELTELIRGHGRRARKSLAMFTETEKQLIEQMNRLGKRGYWSRLRLLEERIKQCKKIEEEFLRERSNLLYQYKYLNQKAG